MSQIIPKVDAAALASVAALAGDNIITEDELSLSRSGTQGGFSFDGSNDYLEGPIDDFGTSDFSLVFDILWDDAPSGVEFFANKSGGNNRWYFYATATQYILSIVDNGGATNTYTWTITPSVNHRSVIITADRSANATLYLNGESQGTQDISAQSAVDLGSGNTNPARIGFSTSSFDGKMFQVRYYNTLKTAGQVLNLAKGHNDTDLLWLHLSPTSTENNLWVDISGNQRSFSNNGATRIESRIGKRYISESEYTTYRKFDGGYYFSAATHVFRTPIDLAGSPSATFLATFKHENIGSFDFLFSDYNSDPNRSFYIGLNSANKIQYFWYDGYAANYNSATSELVLNDGETYVLAIVRNSVSDTDVYLNGEKIPMTVLTAGTGGSTNFVSTTADGISIGNSETLGNHWDGDIYEARIFNYALSDADVKAYSRGAATKWVDIAPSDSGLLGAETATLTSGWSSSGTASTANGTATFDGSGGSITNSAGVPVSDKRYTVTVTVGSYTSGSLRVIMGDIGTIYDLEVDASGDFKITGVADGTNLNLVVYGYGGANGNFNGTVTDVQIKYAGEVAHYSPQSATTTIWEDTSGLENHAVNDGAILLTPSLQETYTTNQSLVSSRIGTGAGYYLDGSNYISLPERDLGTDDFSVSVDVDFKNNGSSQFIWYSSVGATFNRCYIYITYTDLLYFIIQNGVGASTGYNTYIEPGKLNIIYTVDRDGDLSLFINGKKQMTWDFSSHSSVDLGAGHTDVGRLGNNVSGLEGTYYRHSFYNRALTASEVSQISKGQRLGFADANQANGTYSYESDFSVGIDTWGSGDGQNATFTGNNDAVSDGSTSKDDCLLHESNTTYSQHRTWRTDLFTAGKRYRLDITYYIPSENTNVDSVKIRQTSTQTDLLNLTVTGTWTTASTEFVADSTGAIFDPHAAGNQSFAGAGPGDDAFYIAEYNITPLGEVLALLPSSAATGKWYNEGGAGSSGDGTVTGATLINERKRGVFDDLYLDNVPSSDAGLSTGEVYRDNNGHLKIVI